MGTDKATLLVDDTTMAERSVAALEAAGADPVVCVGGRLAELQSLGLAAVDEPHPGEGPLSGILGALDVAEEQCALVIPCDLLEPDPAALTALARHLAAHPDSDVVFARVDDQPQWVVGAWRPTARPALVAAFTSGIRAIRRSVTDLDVIYLDTQRSLANDADHPIDLR